MVAIKRTFVNADVGLFLSVCIKLEFTSLAGTWPPLGGFSGLLHPNLSASVENVELTWTPALLLFLIRRCLRWRAG